MKKLIIALLPLMISSCAADGSFQSWQERAEQNRIEEINRLPDAARQRDSKPNEYAYNEGAVHGCDSGSNSTGDWTKKFQKNVDQYIKNPYYKNGWDDGFAKCKGNGEIINNVINKSL